jgi:hypothetical protein
MPSGMNCASLGATGQHCVFCRFMEQHACAKRLRVHLSARPQHLVIWIDPEPRWKAGDAIPREAEVILLRKGLAIQVLVVIAGRKVESWKEKSWTVRHSENGSVKTKL